MALINECARTLEIDLKIAEGLPVDPGSLKFYSEHIASCSDCRLERALFETMSNDEAGGALPPLDDLTRRRSIDTIVAQGDKLQNRLEEDPSTKSVTAIIEDIIARADEPIFDDDDEHYPGNASERQSRFRKIGFASALIAASVAAVVFWLNPVEAPVTERTQVLTPAPQPKAQLGSQFVLLFGDVTVGTQPAVIGDSLMPGDRIETSDGRAIVHLPNKIAMSLGPKTHLKLEKGENSAMEVVLDKGQIHVSVTPLSKRPPFYVVTHKGRVKVTGTVFSVDADNQAVEVRVLKGEVEISDRKGRQRRLGTGSGTSLGSPKMWTLSKEEEAPLRENIRAFELLGSKDSTKVEIQSNPAGATVVVDSVLLGQTPLHVAIRPGYREFALAINNQQSVRELIGLNSGAHLSRVFNLAKTTTKTDGDDNDAQSAPGKGSLGGKASKTTTGPFARKLLSKAQERRAVRDWSGAAREYQTLILRYPNSAEARASLISLGQIQLEKLGHPNLALRQFDDYLFSIKKGPLAREALLGKARALKALGQREAEKKALRLFLERYPLAIQAAEVRQRLTAL